MSEDSILVALKGMQREIAEMRTAISSLAEKFTQVVGHEVRLARVEADVEDLGGRVDNIERTCITNQKYIDYMKRLEHTPIETPQSWWDRNVSRVLERIIWIALAAAIPAILKWIGGGP